MTFSTTLASTEGTREFSLHFLHFQHVFVPWQLVKNGTPIEPPPVAIRIASAAATSSTAAANDNDIGMISCWKAFYSMIDQRRGLLLQQS